MTLSFVTELMRSTFWTALLVSSPFLILAVVIGLLISIFQATTSLQDQSLSFVPKIILILLSLGFLGNWLFVQLYRFTQQLFLLIPTIAGAAV